MDIHGAETHLKKLLQYVQELAESKPGMYQKSKDRLKSIADTCDQVVKIISEILKDETLVEDECEFGTSQNADLLSVISSMDTQLTMLKQFMNVPQDNVAESPKQKISSDMRRQAIRNYSACFRLLKESENDIVNRCGDFLSTWFDIRFISSIPSHPYFRYNIKRIPQWTCAMVVIYCKHIVQGDIQEFRVDFDNWCENIKNGETGNKYAVPYEVYQFDRFQSPSEMTLAAVVMWDMLFDAGLKDLCINDGSGMYVSEDSMYKLCESCNPRALDRYANYQDMNSVLRVAKLEEVE